MAKDTDKRLAWERQKGESSRAFEAFGIYRDMGPGRSTQKVAGKLAKSWTIIRRWATQWNWVVRATQYDDHLDAEFRVENAKQLKAARKRHINIARRIQTKVMARLRNMEPDEINAQNMALLLKTATDIELRALGDPTASVAIDDKRQRFVVEWVEAENREDDSDLAPTPQVGDPPDFDDDYDEG